MLGVDGGLGGGRRNARNAQTNNREKKRKQGRATRRTYSARIESWGAIKSLRPGTEVAPTEDIAGHVNSDARWDSKAVGRGGIIFSADCRHFTTGCIQTQSF